MINVTRSSMPNYEEYCNEIKDLWESHILTNGGQKHRELEKKISHFLGVKNTVLFTNGHSALELLLKSLNLTGEVITTPFTFVSTTNAIVQAGLKPVFCDINTENYTIDIKKIEDLITPLTCAILPVHVYGNICDVDGLEEISKKYGIPVIYDAAHVFGVKYRKRGIGTYGDASMFSFHATKVYNTIEGGAVVTSDDNLAVRLNGMKNFGLTPDGDVLDVGGNAKMNEFSAAMGLCNLRHVDDEIRKREKVEAYYRALLSDVEGIRLNSIQDNVEPNHAYFPVLFDGYKKARNQIYDELRANGIMARKYFYPATNALTCYISMGYNPLDTPVADFVSKNILCLPMYADLREEEVEMICKIVLN